MLKLVRRFTVEFQDHEKMEFFDILSLEDQQITEVLNIASEHNIKQLRDYESKGIDLSYLTSAQKGRVILTKNRVVFGRSPHELREQRKVVVTFHSQERILERIGSDEIQTILDVIQRIIDADTVLKAQFKGYSSLSYSLTNSRDRIFKLPISFKQVQGRRQILSVTVVSREAKASEMTQKITEDDELADRLAAFKRNLVKRSREK